MMNMSTDDLLELYGQVSTQAKSDHNIVRFLMDFFQFRCYKAITLHLIDKHGEAFVLQTDPHTNTCPDCDETFTGRTGIELCPACATPLGCIKCFDRADSHECTTLQQIFRTYVGQVNAC